MIFLRRFYYKSHRLYRMSYEIIVDVFFSVAVARIFVVRINFNVLQLQLYPLYGQHNSTIIMNCNLNKEFLF